MSGKGRTSRALATVACAALVGCHRAEPAGGPIEVEVCFGEVGTSPGQFSYPRCIDHDRECLWVIDKMARVQRLNPQTGEGRGEWQMPEWKDGKPTGVTVWDPPGQDGPLLLIPDTHYHRVMVYDGGSAKGAGLGTLLTEFGVYGKGSGEFVFPTDIAVLPASDGRSITRLYVSEYQENDRISVYEPATPVTKEMLVASAKAGTAPCPFEFKFSFGVFGSSALPGQVEFSRPQSLGLDLARNELIVTDACNHRIGRFTLRGELIAWISGPENLGNGPGQFSYPYGLALLGDGTALVAEFQNSRVQHVDLATGQSLGIYGQAGRGKGQLATPWGVTVMGERAFVLDSGNNRVIGFEAPRRRRVALGGAP